MYKAKILQKIKSVAEAHKNKANDESFVGSSGKKLAKGYTAQLEQFRKVFDFKKLGFRSLNKKPKEDAIIDHHNLTLEDFSYEEITANYRSAFVDPGRKAVFTAAIGLETERHEIRRCSTKEYYHMTGSTRINTELERKKANCTIKDIESNIPSCKTGSPEHYKIYTTYILQLLGTLFSFYGSDMGETRFRLYQGQQACCRYNVEHAC
ncbi:hypothetical protein BDF20DRAFT_916332 [Mycotypha africana]|uniref:uncharacterized protein n=1 Tax=Mycotypha africana TaxID=64632 RepID=UPI00230171D7|nr:uncharacterized protein BDF20DRAFT_916332 [Mycotypha africana]KAI8968897.1 hypothetical protein BDF20DRAFT_916332 [Mycotypha africana]